MVQQRGPRGGNADEEDADLAVVFLAEPAVVLPGHARGVYALLGEGRLVDDTDDAGGRPGRRGDQLAVEDGLEFSLDVVVLPGALLMNFWRPETSPWPTRRAIGSTLLRSGQTIRPLT